MKQSSANDGVNVSIPAQLYHLIEQRAREAEFDSAEEYIVFALTELTREAGDTFADQIDLTTEDESKIMDRLRGLGYIE